MECPINHTSTVLLPEVSKTYIIYPEDTKNQTAMIFFFNVFYQILNPSTLPGLPWIPGGPGSPLGPCKAIPGDPGGPLLPGGPGGPGKPASPLVPGKPGAPDGPGRPGSPFTPLNTIRGRVDFFFGEGHQ